MKQSEKVRIKSLNSEIFTLRYLQFLNCEIPFLKNFSHSKGYEKMIIVPYIWAKDKGLIMRPTQNNLHLKLILKLLNHCSDSDFFSEENIQKGKIYIIFLLFVWKNSV